MWLHDLRPCYGKAKGGSMPIHLWSWDSSKSFYFFKTLHYLYCSCVIGHPTGVLWESQHHCHCHLLLWDEMQKPHGPTDLAAGSNLYLCKAEVRHWMQQGVRLHPSLCLEGWGWWRSESVLINLDVSFICIFLFLDISQCSWSEMQGLFELRVPFEHGNSPLSIMHMFCTRSVICSTVQKQSW